MRHSCPLAAASLLATLSLSGCIAGEGKAGRNGSACTVTKNNSNGTATITCDDGTVAAVSSGRDGVACSVDVGTDGVKTITCDDGTTATVRDGSGGAVGLPGYASNAPRALMVTITGVSTAPIAGRTRPVVSFNVKDERGAPFAGLQAARLLFTVAKLLPPAGGGSGRFVSYLNRVEVAGALGDGDGSDALQATAEGGTAGSLVDRHDGSYIYTFDRNLLTVTSPVAVPFEPSLRHRVGLQISGAGLPAANVVFDFVPTPSGASSSRAIVTTARCNLCHDRLAAHAGTRVEVAYCVTCHNPGTTDAQSSNSLDLGVMTHKIHAGRNLPSVRAGKPYHLWGFGGELVDFSTVGFPRRGKSCAGCHVADAAAPDAAFYRERPTRAACGSCHDDIDFTIPTGPGPGFSRGHSGPIQTSDTGCAAAACHPAASIDTAHEDPALTQAKAFWLRQTDVSARPGTRQTKGPRAGRGLAGLGVLLGLFVGAFDIETSQGHGLVFARHAFRVEGREGDFNLLAVLGDLAEGQHQEGDDAQPDQHASHHGIQRVTPWGRGPGGPPVY